MESCTAPSDAAPEETTEAGSEPGDIDREIKRLAALRAVDYEKARKEAAAALGVRASVLDKLVAVERPSDDAPGNGRALKLDSPEPWPEPIDGVGLLRDRERNP
ncbi:MAG TPA: hypothetical protein VIL70_02745 [Chthoniobacterales bacterium]